jgi:fatty-acyl-CoA synthase
MPSSYPVLAEIRTSWKRCKRFVFISAVPGHALPDTLCRRVRSPAGQAGSPSFAFPDFDENTRATTFYTTGTTGLPKGVFFSHRQLVLHAHGRHPGRLAPRPSQGRLHRDDVYMPITPMFHVHAWGVPYIARCWA